MTRDVLLSLTLSTHPASMSSEHQRVLLLEVRPNLLIPKAPKYGTTVHLGVVLSLSLLLSCEEIGEELSDDEGEKSE